jgi:mannose-1-phosphate guanylyltransferase
MAINTHHLAPQWKTFYPEHAHGEYEAFQAYASQWENIPLTFFHESTLLETAGGLKNMEAWIKGDHLLIYNGDVYSTIDLEYLMQQHIQSGLPVTLGVRSQGEAKHLALSSCLKHVIDIRHQLRRAEGTHLFTGVYCIRRDFLNELPRHQIGSVIPHFLRLAEQHLLGAVILDEGIWLDLGSPEQYLKAHFDLGLADPIHPLAQIHPSAQINHSVIGEHATIDANAIVNHSVVWKNAHVKSGATYHYCVVLPD